MFDTGACSGSLADRLDLQSVIKDLQGCDSALISSFFCFRHRKVDLINKAMKTDIIMDANMILCHIKRRKKKKKSVNPANNGGVDGVGFKSGPQVVEAKYCRRTKRPKCFTAVCQDCVIICQSIGKSVGGI